MERQRSFTLKPTRFLLLSFTVSSSMLFCFFFSSWVIHETTPLKSHFHFSPVETKVENLRGVDEISSFTGVKNVDLGDTHLRKNGGGGVLGETLFRGTVKDDILEGTHLRRVTNSSEGDLDLEGTHLGESVGSSGQALDSVRETQNPVFGDTHLRDAVDPPEWAVDSVIEAGDRIIEDNDDSSDEEDEEFTVEESDDSETSSEQDWAVKDENISSSVGTPTSSGGTIQADGTEKCDIFNGRWVFDENYPLYSNSTCPYIDEGFSCESNGRLDRNYMKWRWQPHHCDIPRFDAVKMLELIRGKRLVFVGDSINRNQWESMMCLLRGAITDPKCVYEARGRRITKEKGNYNFKFVDYHCSVEYYVTHFLVHEGKARVGRKRAQTLRIDTIDRSSSKWKGADILVFNTAHWWNHHKTRAGVNYYQEGDRVHQRLDALIAFQRALKTWASWVDHHVNPNRTQVFFRSSAPSHFRGGEWNSGGHCMEATQPHNDTLNQYNPRKNLVIEQVIKEMRTPVTLLNITGLSQFRIDGHPSIYGRKGSPRNIQDCSHWCLPGVPDTWNELLYYNLLSQQKRVSVN